MAIKTFFLSVLCIMMYTAIITSQPIKKHTVKRHAGWESEESPWSWPSSDEDAHPRHLHYHKHNEHGGHTLSYHLPTHRHHHYTGHSIDYYRHRPQVYPPLAPIHNPNILPTEKASTTTTPTTTITSTTTIKPEIFPAPVFEVIDEETDDDRQMPPQSASTTEQNVPIGEVNPGVDLTNTAKTSSGIDLRFGA